jgi:uncharacterized repeat protein (TIGR01451 family)
MFHSAALTRRSFLSFLCLATLLLAPVVATADPDLPGATANFENIEAGALVIPMDTTNQAVVAPFNIKAYGLVNNLLQNEIPVKWAIRVGKAKDGIDFSVSASRILPGAVAAATVDFSGGPFIVPKEYAAEAETLATAFANDVAVFRTEADVSVDIRYTITVKPFINVSDENSAIHTALLDAAGIPASNYTVGDPSTLTANTCATIHMEPHRKAPGTSSTRDAVMDFISGGGNFLAQCQAVEHFEGKFDTTGEFLTTDGVTISNVDQPLDFIHPDMAFSQIVGPLSQKPGGSEQDFTLGTGSFVNNGYVHAQDATSTDHFAAASGKVLVGVGGNVFYLGGHDYLKKCTTIDCINGQRMALNAIFVPSDRPQVCGFNFGLVQPSEELEITKSDGVDAVDPGAEVSYTIVVSNVGSDDADGTVFTDPAVANFTASTVTCGSASGGATCPTVGNTTVALMQGAGIVIPDLPAGGSVTFTVTGTAGDSGFITNIGYITGPADTTESAADTNTIESTDVSITKVSNQTTVPPHGELSWTIVVSNGGPGAADGTVFSDPAVANFTATGVTCGNALGGAVCPAPGDTTVSAMQNDGIVIPTLPAGGSVTFTVTGTAGAGDSIANTAYADGPSGDSASAASAVSIAQPVPALDPKGLALLAMLLAVAAIVLVGRRA